MKILIGLPPNFEAISKRFKVAGKPVLYAYGDTIFNPFNMHIPEHLLHHEAMHGHRQKGDIQGWWDKYLTDNEFLIAEEVMAHAAEYRCLIRTNSNRHGRRSYLKETAQRLAGPLYGNLLSVNKAMRLLREKI